MGQSERAGAVQQHAQHIGGAHGRRALVVDRVVADLAFSRAEPLGGVEAGMHPPPVPGGGCVRGAQRVELHQRQRTQRAMGDQAGLADHRAVAVQRRRQTVQIGGDQRVPHALIGVEGGPLAGGQRQRAADEAVRGRRLYRQHGVAQLFGDAQPLARGQRAAVQQIELAEQACLGGQWLAAVCAVQPLARGAGVAELRQVGAAGGGESKQLHERLSL